MRLSDLVDEYLRVHQAAPVTVAKLRWLPGKATVTLGDGRLAELSPRQVYAWRLTILFPNARGVLLFVHDERG